MKKHAFRVALAVGFATSAFLPAPHAEAALISDSRIEAQRDVVEEVRKTAVEERIKLVQMLLINALEKRMDLFRDQIENQK